MANGNLILIQPSREYRSGNPYTALIGTEQDFVSGDVRFEPPCELSQEYLEGVASDVGVLLVHHLTTSEASLFSFEINPENVWKDRPAIKTLKYTVRSILDDLGQVYNSNLYRKRYTKIK